MVARTSNCILKLNLNDFASAIYIRRSNQAEQFDFWKLGSGIGQVGQHSLLYFGVFRFIQRWKNDWVLGMIKCFSLLILIYLNPCPSEFETMDRETGKRVRQVLLLNRLESPQEQEHFLDNLSRNSKFRNLLGRLYPSNQESGARTDGPDPCSSNGFIWITALCFIQGNQPIVFESLALYLAASQGRRTPGIKTPQIGLDLVWDCKSRPENHGRWVCPERIWWARVPSTNRIRSWSFTSVESANLALVNGACTNEHKYRPGWRNRGLFWNAWWFWTNLGGRN